MKLFKTISLFCIFLSSFTNIHAATISSSLFDLDGEFGAGITVDRWDFTLSSNDIVTFDMLSWERVGNDVNGDGEYAFFDTYITLYTDNGNGTYDYFASNNGSGGGTDGSISNFDSYMKIALDAGDYSLLVSSCCELLNADATSQFYGRVNNIDVHGQYSTNLVDQGRGFADHGDYQLTFSDNLLLTNPPSAVPEPATAFMFAPALLLCLGLRRRAKQA